MDSHLALWIGGFIVFALTLFQVCFRYVYGYDITRDQVRIMLFESVPLMRIRIADILEISERSHTELWKLTLALKFGNRLWGKCVLIRKKNGLIRSIVITPDDAHAFVERVRAITRELEPG
jgi:hypothetical protein